MYVPAHNQVKDRATLIAFMRAHSFATVISHSDGGLRATHLPVLIEEVADRVQIKAHLAKANPQWKEFVNDRELLVIFSGPHAYISPRLYERAESVPTWNYAAVHASGTPRIIESLDDRYQLLEQLITLHDADYLAQFRGLRSEYVSGRLNAVVAFAIDVTRLEARWKLSQDRLPTERARIIGTLETGVDGAGLELAQLMRENDPQRS